jgi:amidase
MLFFMSIPEQASSIESILLETDIAQMLHHYNASTFTIQQVVEFYLDRIDRIDHNGPGFNAMLTVNFDALSIAQELDRELKAGFKQGPLHGIPVLLKDNSTPMIK